MSDTGLHIFEGKVTVIDIQNLYINKCTGFEQTSSCVKLAEMNINVVTI